MARYEKSNTCNLLIRNSSGGTADNLYITITGNSHSGKILYQTSKSNGIANYIWGGFNSGTDATWVDGDNNYW